jgi:predicted phosphoribosyltransferase
MLRGRKLPYSGEGEFLMEDIRDSPVWNTKLVESIRNSHANISMIAEYEEKELLSYEAKIELC